MFEKSIFFIQEEDVGCFFSHSFCVIEESSKNKKTKKKKTKMKLRSCCFDKCEIGII